jgi:dTMP kinase
MFISFEGTEGVGKTTLIQGLTAHLQAKGRDVILTREPGGTPLAEQIRALLLTPSDEAVAVDCELLMMYAARAQHVQGVILPALNSGHWVLCDRFVDASYAYQCGGRGIERHKLDLLTSQFVPAMPQLTFWLDAPVELGMQRARARGVLDRFEQEKLTFFQRVRGEYQARHQAEPHRVIRLDATQQPADVLQQAVSYLAQFN